MQQGYEKQFAKDFSVAIELCTQGLKAVANNPAGWTSLGICYQAVDDFTNAYLSYKRAYCMDRNGQVANLYFIAVLDEHFGKGSEAWNNYRTYIREDPHGNYVAIAQQGVDSLVRNIGATQRIHTEFTSGPAACSPPAH